MPTHGHQDIALLDERDHPAVECLSMGFSKRRMESERAAVAAKEAEARRLLDPQILADAERLVAAWE